MRFFSKKNKGDPPITEGADYNHLLRIGDQLFIKELYRSVLPQVRSWIVKNGGTDTDAQDIFHQSLESLIISAHQDKLNISGDIEPYLFKICRNKWIDRLRKNKKTQWVSIEEESREIREEAIEYEMIDEQQILKSALDKTYLQLSSICQELITLVNKSTPIGEITERLNMSSANTVYRRKFACMKRWRELLLSDCTYQQYKAYHES